MTRWKIWFTGNRARNWIWNMLPNGTCKNQNPSWRIRCIKSSGTLRYKRIPKSLPEKTDIEIINKKKRKCEICISFKSLSEKKNNYKKQKNKQKNNNKKWYERQLFGLARELRKLWNMKRIAIPIVIVILGTVSQRFWKRVESVGNGRTNHDHPNYNIFRSARILRWVLETWEDLLFLILH